MGKEKKIFIAATRQNDGKTVVSVGLVLTLKKIFSKVGFIKPVGQKYVLVDGEKVDKDAILMKKVCGIEENLKDINPIAVEEGFTQRYLDSPNPSDLIKKIKESYEKVSAGKDVVVIEGTGHAGVGSIFDLNNSTVAKILESPVLLVSIGGIGRPVDEISLNAVFFEKEKVPLKGVIINKIISEKRHTVEKYIKRGLDKMNIKLLGLIPFVSLLSQPNLFQICESVKGKAIAGEEKLFKKIENIIVGAMTPRHALNFFKPNSLLITPGDREDLILAALSQHSVLTPPYELISGIVLTGGLYPHKTILDIIKKIDLPTIITSGDTYEVASEIHGLVAKIREEDIDKIEIAQKLVEENINISEIF